MLILLEGPDETRNAKVVSGLTYLHEPFLKMEADEAAPLEDAARFFIPHHYEPGHEPSLLLTEWHWTSVVVNDPPPFGFTAWKRLETHLGRRGCLAVYVEPSEPDPDWDVVVEGSRLPKFRIEPEANLNVALREVLALGHLLEESAAKKAS